MEKLCKLNKSQPKSGLTIPRCVFFPPRASMIILKRNTMKKTIIPDIPYLKATLSLSLYSSSAMAPIEVVKAMIVHFTRWKAEFAIKTVNEVIRTSRASKLVITYKHNHR